MNDVRKILLDSAAALAALVVVGFALGGAWFGLGVAAAGTLTLVNLGVLGWITSRLARAIGLGRSEAAALLVLFFKFLLAIAGYGALLMVFPPLSIAAGLCCGVAGLSVRSMVDVLRLSEDPIEEPLDGPDQES